VHEFQVLSASPVAARTAKETIPEKLIGAAARSRPGDLMKALAEHEVRFVTGSQHLYGADALRLVEDHSRQIAGALDESAAVPVRVVSKPVVTTSESTLGLCLAATAAQSCVGVTAWMHTFPPARMWIAGLTALQKPLLHLHTLFNRDLRWAEIDMDFMNLNQSAHGDREFAYLETRLRRSRATVVGHWQDPDVVDRVGIWARAACGGQEVHWLRLARFGDNVRQVAVTEGDNVEAKIRLGTQVRRTASSRGVCRRRRAASGGVIARHLVGHAGSEEERDEDESGEKASGRPGDGPGRGCR
jgi:L-arabinose isomerase